MTIGCDEVLDRNDTFIGYDGIVSREHPLELVASAIVEPGDGYS
jgi:hypothetical protein